MSPPSVMPPLEVLGTTVATSAAGVVVFSQAAPLVVVYGTVG